MQTLAIIIAVSGVGGPHQYPGPYVTGFCIIVVIASFIGGIVNRKKLDEICKDDKAIGAPKFDDKPWKCPKCGEIFEPQVDSCRKCEAAMKDDDAA